MHQKTLGVIGLGKIGKCLINIAFGFGMKVVVYDKFEDENYAKEKHFNTFRWKNCTKSQTLFPYIVLLIQKQII